MKSSVCISVYHFTQLGYHHHVCDFPSATGLCNDCTHSLIDHLISFVIIVFCLEIRFNMFSLQNWFQYLSSKGVFAQTFFGFTDQQSMMDPQLSIGVDFPTQLICVSDIVLDVMILLNMWSLPVKSFYVTSDNNEICINVSLIDSLYQMQNVPLHISNVNYISVEHSIYFNLCWP